MFLTWRPGTIRLLKSDRNFSLHTFSIFVHKIGNIEHFVPTRIAVFPGLYKTSRKITGKIEHFRAQKKRAPFPTPAFPAFLSYVIVLVYSHNNFSSSLYSDYFPLPFHLQSIHADRAKLATQNKRLSGVLLRPFCLVPACLLSTR